MHRRVFSFGVPSLSRPFAKKVCCRIPFTLLYSYLQRFICRVLYAQLACAFVRADGRYDRGRDTTRHAVVEPGTAVGVRSIRLAPAPPS